MFRTLTTALALATIAAAHPPAETVTPTFNQRIPNIPGKSVVAAVVDHPPGGASPAHRHAPYAFILAYVLSGRVESSVDGSPVRTYGPGESWSEPPGAHHSVSRNASATQHARLLAVFVLDTGSRDLTVPDRRPARR